MKCLKCGTEIKNGSLFCRNCGSIQSTSPIKYCRECGAKLRKGEKTCPKCGSRVLSIKEQIAMSAANDSDFDKTNSESESKENMEQEVNEIIAQKNHGESLKNEIVSLLIAMMAVISTYAFTAPVSNRKNGENTVATLSPVSEEKDDDELPADNGVKTNYSINTNASYAYMADEWNVYIARPQTDKTIKIEHFDKASRDNKDMLYSDDIGTFQINDNRYRFSWLDDSHTAFDFIFRDESGSSNVKRYDTHTFTININDNAAFRGTDYSDQIREYKKQFDDWHEYRAIPLTDNLIKIECWSRGNINNDFVYGWDWRVINLPKNDLKFQWTDDEKTSFIIEGRDKQNSYWKSEESVLFEMENPEYKYETVNDFLNEKENQDSTEIATEPPAPTATPIPTCDGTTVTTACQVDGVMYNKYIYHPAVAEQSHMEQRSSEEQVQIGTRTLCNDGTTSGARGRGACSHHGGVASWNDPIYDTQTKTWEEKVIDVPAQDAYYETEIAQ